MTMDRVYNSQQQYGFQQHAQQQQSLQQQHQQPQHVLQSQHLYRNTGNNNNHLTQPTTNSNNTNNNNNPNSHILLHHHHGTARTTATASTTNALPVLHRPVHTPPSPPTLPSQQSSQTRCVQAATSATVISTTDTIERPLVTVNSTSSSVTTTLRPVNQTTDHSHLGNSRNSIPQQQQHYYVNTPYQQYQPSGLMTHQSPAPNHNPHQHHHNHIRQQSQQLPQSQQLQQHHHHHQHNSQQLLHHHQQQQQQQLHHHHHHHFQVQPHQQQQHQQQQQQQLFHNEHQYPNLHLQHQPTNGGVRNHQNNAYFTMTENSNASDTQDGTQIDHFTEEVIQAILAAKDALEKPSEERDDRDIMLIDNLCSLAHGFDAFPKTVRRALAAQICLIVIDEKGKELIVHNEELDSFCVLIFGECEQLDVTKTVPIRYYHVGDAFGICEPTTETLRFVGHMITRCENCAFLCVKRDEFYSILTDPANYPSKDLIRHRDRNGNIICVSQFNIDRKSSGPLWSYYMQSTNTSKVILPDGHIITKATEACLLMALVDGYDKLDPEYVDDFLLLFRVFMTHDLKDKEKKLPPGMIKLCLTLTKWLDQTNYRDKVVKIVLTWLSSYYHDFELNSDFSYLFFRVLESKLMKLSMENQLHLLHVTLSTKSKTRQVTISRSSREQPLSFSISGGYEKNCGIFVTQVYGSNCDDSPDSLLSYYLKFQSSAIETTRGPAVAPRQRANHNLYNQESRVSVPLRPGDQILEVNGTNFSAIQLVEAQKKLDMSTHLSLTVKFNPSEFYEMRALPEGRRKSSLSSVSSVSPFQVPSSQNKFTFNTQDNNFISRQLDQFPPASPFSSNTNFGFRSIMSKTGPKNDKSRLSSLINSSKQFVKQIRDSTVQAQFNNVETMSKTSDNVSDTQSNDLDVGKAKSNPDLHHIKNRDKSIDSSLSNIVRLDDLNPTSMMDHINGGNETLVNVLRVFNAANNEFRYLLVHEETTAREVVMVAVKEFNLTGNSGPQNSSSDKSVSSLDWHLYEVSVVPESKTIKQKCLSEQTSKLAERASLCSRFYIKNNSQNSHGPSKLDMGDDSLVNEILKESPAAITLASLNAALLAVELTLSDFDKFKSIEPQQFVYDTFFDYSERKLQTNTTNGLSADSASLKSSSSDGESDVLNLLNKSRSIPKSWMKEYQEFADTSNKEMFWVVCEILNERNISRRVKIIKKFILVAHVCKRLRNYNSMFAIISGLGHSCVNRLRRTFDKLKPKYKKQLEEMRSLFDPSRNMSNYRNCLSEKPPPAIPLFPQIKKDLTFTKEGRAIFIRESNDLSDDEDFAGNHSQDTIKRKSRGDVMSVKSSTLDQAIGSSPQPPARSISYSGFNNRVVSSDIDSILVNFAEIRQFTERVRNVIHFSSVPYSKDFVTKKNNTKDNQKHQQIKQMYAEWHMRKRIRHYISQTLNCEIVDQLKQNSAEKNLDQVDSASSKSNDGGSSTGPLKITYDERILYQRSLDVEPELNTRPATHQQSVNAPNTNDRQPASTIVQLHPPNQPQVPPAALNMHPPSAANSSPTLSKSSSLSSCSSFNHHMPSYHAPRSNLTSSVGKFGTESTESLRKLQALSENVGEDWSQYNGSNNGSHRVGNEQSRAKSIVSSRIFPPKSGR